MSRVRRHGHHIHYPDSSVTVHVLHGEPKFVLSEYHGPLTCERQLYMRTSLDRQCFNHGISAVLLECALAPEKAR